ncbi:HLA class II histocompatibility antigen, DP beta 1 chain-like [Rhincodon typus]|uniref:HLA class II histocompatibility antigen, DP beta 1 chain-like n=1 Tax=Rhincodon typus TaxID=259920 RepID=UPI00202E9B97|nr:HLA class II histocompatibility antigen, DP beta 1 chain-like [Rhincodon typus]
MFWVLVSGSSGMDLFRVSDSRSLWIRIPLLIGTFILLNGGRDSGTGAHSANYVDGCRFNISGAWTFINQYIYDKELIAYYDFAQKKYIAVKDWMKGSVDRWNKEEAAGTYQDGIRVCENNVPLASEVVSRKVEPTVTIRPKAPQHAAQLALLSCHVTGFYPPEIDITWLKNGAPIPDGVINTVLLSNGDWTYQVEDLLQYQPVSGDKYTCHVEHSSLGSPRSVEWEVQNTSESKRHKIIVGALFFGIGLIILLVGVIMRLKNAKAILDSGNHGPRLMGPAVS